MGVYSLSKSGINNWSKYSNVAGANGQTSDFELIGTIYGNGSSSVVTFTNIPQSYRNLQIRVVVQATSGSATDLYLQLNGDSTNGSYKDHRLYGFNTSVASGSVSTNSIYSGTIGAIGNEATVAPSVIDLLDYRSTVKNKTLKYISGKPTTGAHYMVFGSGLWLNTAAVTSISLFIGSGAFNSPSRFSLYGVK
jgi:hypothetical protein